MNGNYEDYMLREMMQGEDKWCSQCQRTAEDCACSDPIPEKLVQRFNSGWTPEPNSGCWLWHKATNDHGYGQMWTGQQIQYVHRFSWELVNGQIPAGLQVLHHCDTPACVNPDHLFLGNRFANMRDCVNKRRGNTCKLSTEQVIEIRRSTEPSKSIAARLGVTNSLINKIRSGQIWPLCEQCNRPISSCVCEELCDALREQISGPALCVHLGPETRTLPEPTSFSQWLKQTGDSI